MEDKKCPTCGAANLTTARYCKKCGAQLLSEQKPLATTKKTSKIEKPQKSRVLYQILPPMCGFLLTLLFFAIVSAIFSSKSYIYRLFLTTGDPYQRIIPFLTVFLYLWSFLQLVSNLCEVRKEEKGFKEEAILNLPHSISHEEGVKVTTDKISSNKKIRGRLFKRISSLLEQLYAAGDTQRTHEVFRHQSEIDADTAASGYTTVRLFIWAMPILGFLGTVIGIGLAVGNFSSFLTGDIENIEMVKRELSKVATGLSYAFDTTLLGLAASLLTMILTSFVQSREEGFLTKLDALCLKIISRFQAEKSPDLYEAPNDVLISSIEPFQQEMRLLTEKSSQNIQNFADSFSATSQGLSKEFAEILPKLQTEGKGIKEVIADLHKFSQVLGGILENSSGEFKKSVHLLSSHVEPLHSTLNANIQTLNTVNSFAAVLKEMEKTLNNLASLLSRLSGPLEFRLFPSQRDVLSSHMPINPKPPEK